MSSNPKYAARISEIRAAHIFRGLGSKQLAEIAQSTRESRYDAGQVIFQPGDACDRLMVIVTGGVNVSFSSQGGKEVIVAELRAGDVIGEMELLSNSRRLTNGIASSKTRLLAMGRPIFEYLLTDQDFTKALLDTVCQRVQQLLVFAEGLSIHSLETRLARLLVSLSETHGRRVGDAIVIDRTISQSVIGQMINASRPRINVQLQSWKDEKLIRLSDNRITILDERMMRTISRQPAASQ